ncbi:MAG: cell surface protein SprA [Bacteroidia bacterium]|nr:cell surface protein SprA [Bacteroidia bacterium]
MLHAVILFIFSILTPWFHQEETNKKLVILEKNNNQRREYRFFLPDSNEKRKRITFRRKDNSINPTNTDHESPLYAPNPSNVETIYEIDEDGKGYYVHERVGGIDVKPPSYITREEYLDMLKRKQTTSYFRLKSAQQSGSPVSKSLIPKLNINSALFRDIFGSGKVDIKPSGSVLLDLSYRINKNQNPANSLANQRNSTFNFDQQIQLNVVGQIGEKLKLRANWDTKSNFNFENTFLTGYEGGEDDIIKKIEAGNVSLPLNGSLITGGQNLFGVKVAAQFGPVFITSIASQQRGKTNEVTATGGAQKTEFSKKVNEYDENRHFFLNHYFRSVYERATANFPVLTSNINVTRVEVWVTNRSNSSLTNNRNAIGFVDLGENITSNGGVLWNPTVANPTKLYPNNSANHIYQTIQNARLRNDAVANLEASGLKNGEDFELIENMKRLNEQEYRFHPQLGYISLNTKLQQNDVLYVAYEYTVTGDTTVFRVGEFSIDQPSNANNTNVLFLKMLKPSSTRPALNNRPYPTWDLMMKNIYSIGGYNLNKDNFVLDVWYESTGGAGDINYLPTSDVKNIPLIQVLSLDRLTNNMEAGADNRFDFLPNLTVITEKGLIIFPKLEPFGKGLIDKFITNRESDSAKYAYPQLYSMTQVDASQFFPQLNRFKMKGTYQGASSSEIQLNAVQIAQGSIKVTANGIQLTEGSDYIVDYNIGKVTILNQGIINSGQEIKVKYESNTLFGIDQKTMVGSRIDYKFNKDIKLGATILHLNERPLINKINIGDEPLSNTIWGADVSFNKQSKLITKIIDKLPLINTKEPSQVTFNGEFAQMIPGHPRQIQTGDEKGIAYLDDFEGTKNVSDITNANLWKLASFPSNLPRPAGSDPTSAGFTRSKLAWYQIDAIFYTQPKDFGLDKNSPALNLNASRRITPQEVFPKSTPGPGTNLLATLDLHYFPSVRGPYNYQTDGGKINSKGSFINPRENWAGIMRRTSGNTDFEAANFEFIEFWLLDPFAEDSSNTGGNMHLNLGKISEDVLPDNRRSFENGLPTNENDDNNNLNLTTTPWGRVSDATLPIQSFDNNPSARKFQDVGLDGLSSEKERTFFQDYLNKASTVVTDAVGIAKINNDPSSDDFVFFRDDAAYPSGTDIISRYVHYNGTEGNSPIANPGDKFTRSATTTPDVEDLNADGTLSSAEQFYDYEISIRKEDLVVGRNYIVSQVDTILKMENNTDKRVKWYQFRVPLRSGIPINGIQNFKAIDFIRLYLNNFDKETIMRFAKVQLVATQWRRYTNTIGPEDVVFPPTDSVSADFNIATVNIEENSGRVPLGYVIPPNIIRQQQYNSPVPGILQNEQSLVMSVCGLQDGYANAVFKNINFDLRNYKHLKMWIHAEPNLNGNYPANFNKRGDVTCFIRLGTDYVNNYYEYEIPLTPSNLSINTAENIWLEENQLNFALEELNRAKQERNIRMLSYNERYVYVNEKGHKITVLGNPQLNNVKTILIGIRNPKNDGLPVCLEAWINELRVTDFDEFPGWAANARLNLKLADLAQVTVAAARSTPGFGGIEKRLNERSRENMTRYDLTVSSNLGKLLPKKIGLELPIYYAVGERWTDPQYNPLDPDIKMVTRLEAARDEHDRDSTRRAAQDYTSNRSFSLNNARKIKTNSKAKPHLWDVENLALTLSYSEIFSHNSTTAYRLNTQHLASIAYNYSFTPKNYQPFKGKKAKTNLITAFNFYLFPKTISVKLDGNRMFEQNQMRPTANGIIITPTFVQNFTLNRTYSLRWDITKSLGFTFNATNTGRVDEPRGLINSPEKKDTLYRNILSFGRDEANGKYRQINFGRTLNYNQTIQATYRLPFDKVKPLNWISSNVTYNAAFTWQTAALQNQNFGNTISNSRGIQATGQMNFAQFYKKFKKVEAFLKPTPKKNIISKADSSRKEGDDTYIALRGFAKEVVRLIFSVQSADLSYNRTETTILPGYLPQTDNFGLDFRFRDSLGLNRPFTMAPGIGFILGDQKDIRRKAAEAGWITRDTLLTSKYTTTFNEQITGRLSMNVFKGFKIDFNVNRSNSKNYSELFAWDNAKQDFNSFNQVATGTFSSSFLAIGTAWESNTNNESKAFLAFAENRREISRRLALANPNQPLLSYTGETNRGYFNGYNATSQDVLIPAFLAAYGGKKAGSVSLSPFSGIPMPNWTVTFNGLNLSESFKDVFSAITFTHSYRSTYSTNFIYNLRSRANLGDKFSQQTYVVDSAGRSITGSTVQLVNFEPIYNIQTVTISEQFAPILGVNLTMKNGIGATVDLKKDRNLTFNVGALQLAETKNTELTLNLSWRKDKFLFPINLFGKEFEIKNAITTRFEVTLRNSKNQNRRLDSTAPPDFTGGNFGLIIKPSIDYMVSTQLTVRVYYEFNRNKPVMSNSFPTTFSAFGVQVRFTIR